MRLKLILLLFGVLLFSCKKSYTCDCKSTWVIKSSNGNFYTYIFPGEAAPYNEKLTKKQAKAACAHQQVTTESDLNNNITDNGKYPLESGESIKTECNLILA